MKKGSVLKNHTLRKLAHIMAGGEDGQTIGTAHDFLVEQTLLEKGKDKSAKDIRKGLEEVFGLRFSNEEVGASINRLKSSGKIIEKNSRYTLSLKRDGELKKLNSDTKSQEKNVYKKWLDTLSERYPSITKEEKELLLVDLKEYVHRTFLRSGAECAVFINPDSNPTDLSSVLSEDILLDITKNKSEEIQEIEKYELPFFLQDLTSEKRDYLSKLLDGTFIYNIIHADKETLQGVKDHLKNYVFFLDTNVLYALLDLHDSKQTTTVEKAFTIARTFGVKFVASSKTVEEMNRSIELKSQELLNAPNVRKDLAQLGADLSEEENFITSYWRSFAKTNISKQDFIDKFKHLPELLRLKDIEVVEAIDNIPLEDLEKEKALLNSSISSKKTDNIATHDAYHRLFIKKLREETLSSEKETEYWFLSLDSQLAIYAQKTRQQGERPFMYMPHQLLQILRLFEQRTKDYDATFLELFNKPQIKSAQNVLPNDLAQRVVSKISGYADLPRDLAIRIVVDQKFLSTVATTKETEVQEKLIEERVEHELVERVRNLEEGMRLLQEEKNKEEKSKEQTETDNRGINRQNKQLRWALLVVSILLILILFALTYIFLWKHLGIPLKVVVQTTFFVLLLLALRIKWSFGTSLKTIGAFAGIIIGVFIPFAYFTSVEKTADNSEVKPGTTESLQASTSTPEATSTEQD